MKTMTLTESEELGDLQGYEHLIPAPRRSLALQHSLESSKDTKTSKLTLDDIDLTPLDTTFDKQMFLGLPMFLEKEREPDRTPVNRSMRAIYDDPPSGISDIIQAGELRKKYMSMLSQRNNLNNSNISLQSIELTSGRKKLLLITRTVGNVKHVTYRRDSVKMSILDSERIETLIAENDSNIPTFNEFKNDFDFMVKLTQSHNLNKIAGKRLQYLKDKFELYQSLNAKTEILQNKMVPHRDFYNTRKIDQNLLLSGCISQHQLNDFICKKIATDSERVVYINSTGSKFKLKDIFKIMNSCTEAVHFNMKIIDDEFLEWYHTRYLPNYHIIPFQVIDEEALKGKTLYFFLLAKTFLEFDNSIEGEYLAQLLKERVINPLEESVYQLAQLSVDFQFYPLDKDKDWWFTFSDWIVRWNLISPYIRWNIQLSRSYKKLFKVGRVENFQDYFDIIFNPLLTADNVNNSNLQIFLSSVCSFDLHTNVTDDYLWHSFLDTNCLPKLWTGKGDNPTISQYLYYIFVNISKINNIRFINSQNTFLYRSNCSPLNNHTSQFSDTLCFTTLLESLIGNFLLCNGGLLDSEPIWQNPTLIPYLFYLYQIPIVTQPLSSATNNRSNKLDISSLQMPEADSFRNVIMEEQSNYLANPFMTFFKIGFKVSLSSKSILFNNSYTAEPLVEEYGVASHIYLLNAADLCELARTSVQSSGYGSYQKRNWLGISSRKGGFFKDNMGFVDVWYDVEYDTSEKHNVPILRRKYRFQTLKQEWLFIMTSS
ncbi:metallo-dependent hydrolase superfamily protein NDAI_0B04910 [Naumovozyma dairenensis CBS 421]|uniref:Uncharacterized protein n=1 Tax=Naumovozyma dairenensis (strain ATCC 10597 / BCRC 20456 / CBS 421 / NBRC 0211 / NRRL Y-12639) TaxID=1071378 RepID=G0W6W4_NAUDC|nr:hypothetical protein NDAI_0B04910 [Naumovozyma dairenensis CBS 421]CCD23525.1 hypothetical protein NDAI_0B04910 [Naumovozyma dairenensis CBS 421]